MRVRFLVECPIDHAVFGVAERLAQAIHDRVANAVTFCRETVMVHVAAVAGDRAVSHRGRRPRRADHRAAVRQGPRRAVRRLVPSPGRAVPRTAPTAPYRSDHLSTRPPDRRIACSAGIFSGTCARSFTHCTSRSTQYHVHVVSLTVIPGCHADLQLPRGPRTWPVAPHRNLDSSV